MSESSAISAHGTVVKRNGTTIAELRDITPPPLTRKAIETTNQNSDDDSYVVGVRRKGELQFLIGYLPSGEATHNAAAGLMKAWHDGSKDKYEISFPDGAGWMFSGFVTNLAPHAPTDDGLTADLSIRPSGGHVFTPGS